MEQIEESGRAAYNEDAEFVHPLASEIASRWAALGATETVRLQRLDNTLHKIDELVESFNDRFAAQR